MSRNREVEVLVDPAELGRGEIRVRSPRVGVYSDAPRSGEVLVGRSRAGRLTCLGRTVSLVLPRGVSGRVAEPVFRNRRDPVEYGQVLLRLLPIEATVSDEAVAKEPAARRGLPDGSYPVVSPTHGMFYRRPRADAPTYVDIGHIVEEGATLALVEVMKCFSAITYGGEGLPPRAQVVEVRAEDGAEVQAEQVLFVVRPAPA